MSMFMRRRKHRMPGLNMSSMPDLIFTVLFFFMIVTNMREVQLKVEYQVPHGKELERLAKKSSVIYIHIGRLVVPATNATNATNAANAATDTAAVRIQMNDKLVEVGDIAGLLIEERSQMAPEDVAAMTVCIKADKDTPMRIVNDVKQALREADVLNVVYFADNKDK